ncbi:CAP domain-containing protein [Glycomyces buryatensis]|uniref:CAP domain-containing protein n=1 Tax=Glycomyces buryatensis TaxID=2570927 RepID=A0A4V4HST3_9ACTN|nr:CAP domain-containing protein [Glycomyces buryatensis]THV42926.1 CAP domain-containing protein [Glycomyces buryatensis]
MTGPQGGRHRDPAEPKRRMLLAILLAFGLAAAGTSLWALDSPLDGTAISSESGESPDSPATSESNRAQADAQGGDTSVHSQEPEPAPTTEAATTEAEPTEPEPEPEESSADDAESGSDNEVESAVVDLVNTARDEAGCGALESDPLLDTAARLHAEDMATNDYFDHTGLDGSSPTDRAEEQGFEGGVGENIAAGYPDAESVMEGWMNSEGHRANILNCGYNVIGVGLADRDGTLYWVQNFGS